MAQEFVDKEIKNPVVIFSKSYCPFCKKAKDVFKSLNVTFTLHELDERSEWDCCYVCLLVFF